MVVDNLYYNTPCEFSPTPNGEGQGVRRVRFKNASASFSFNDEVIKQALLRIYKDELDPATQIEENIFNETWRIFNQATAEGAPSLASFIPPSPNGEGSGVRQDFAHQIRYNNAVFSAFRTHRLQNDIAAKLLDADGNLKPFEQFSNDVQPITDHSVKQWLRTEYDTAVIRAHRAEDWQRFKDTKDIFPNLTWMPTTSVTPDPEHQRYWSSGLTLPIDHPFWSQHAPGDRWNCKCYLEETDSPVKGERLIDSKEQPQPDKGLDNNPGRDGKLFSDTHPYIANAAKGAKKAVQNFIKEKVFIEDFTPYKQFKNGGNVQLHKELDKKASDYKMLLSTALDFAKQGKEVKVTKNLYYDSRGINDSSAYERVFGQLEGTKYEGKSPDLIINGQFYELESFIPPFKKKKVSKMITRGAEQSSRIIINNTKGASDRYIKRLIYDRINNPDFKYDIDEVWLYEKGKVRRLH